MQKKTLLSLATVALSLSLGGAAFAQFGGNVPGTNVANARAEVYSKLVNTRLPIDFTENPLRDVIQFLADYGEIDILTKWDESGFGDGLDPEAQITIHLNNPTSLEAILEIVMKQATSEETSWNLGEGFVEIGLKDTLIKNKYVRLYPVRELIFAVPIFTNAPQMDLESVLGGGNTGEITGSLFGSNTQSSSSRRQNRNGQNSLLTDAEQPRAEELMEIITSIIDPLQWEKNGGEGGSMRYFKGSLIVNATDFLHRQVGGYPFVVSSSSSASARRTASLSRTPRWVTLTGRFGFTKILDIEKSEIPVLVGGRVISSGRGDG